MAEIKAKAKTIGMKVPPVLYTKLSEAKDRLGIKSMKEAALRSCIAGVGVLLAAPEHDVLAGYPHVRGDRWERDGSKPIYTDSVGATGALRMSDGTSCRADAMHSQGWVRSMSVFSTEMGS